MIIYLFIFYARVEKKLTEKKQFANFACIQKKNCRFEDIAMSLVGDVLLPKKKYLLELSTQNSNIENRVHIQNTPVRQTVDFKFSTQRDLCVVVTEKIS